MREQEEEEEKTEIINDLFMMNHPTNTVFIMCASCSLFFIFMSNTEVIKKREN